MYVVKKEPRMRRDKTCYWPDCRQELPSRAVEYKDPFCSAACARRFYEVNIDHEKEDT